MMVAVFRTLPNAGSQSPIRWRDKKGKMHAVEGVIMHPGTKVLWTCCGLHDVPANASWLGQDGLTCVLCQDVSGAEEHMSSALLDVAAERLRQVEAEGWSAEHDDKHSRGEMIRAAINYAAAASISVYLSRSHDYPDPPPFREHGQAVRWPWDLAWWKPSNPRRDLVKAAALIIAEIERLDRSKL